MEALPEEVANPVRNYQRFKKPMYTFIVSILAAFVTTFVLMLIAISLAFAFRPGGLEVDEYVKLEEEGFGGHCLDCDDKVKYVLVCDGEKQVWGRSGYMGAAGMIYYAMNGGILEPVFDLQHWCNIQDLGNVMHGAHAVVWPFVLIFANLGISVFYDMKSDKRFVMGWQRMLQRNAIAAVIHGFVFSIVYLIASAADGSELNTAAQTVYVFTVVSYALYIPGRLLLDQGQYFDKTDPEFFQRYSWIPRNPNQTSFIKNAIVMACLLLLPLIYAFILIVAFTLEGRAFHPTGPMWDGIGYIVAEIVFVILLNLPVFYLAEDWEKQDIPLMDRNDPEIPEALPDIYEEVEGREQPRAIEDIEAQIAVPIADLGDPEYEEITI
jgi:hypothetical protein